MSTVDIAESEQPRLIATNIVIVVLACISVVLRVLARRITGLGLDLDDYIIFVALFVLFAAFALALLGISYGTGKHVQALEGWQVLAWGKTLLAFEVIYVICIAIIKCSLLALYIRIFPVREIRLGAWILGSITAVWGIAIILVCIFQCTPVQKAWAPTVPGTCINLRASFIGNAVPNILTDVAIIVLPVREVWKLQTRRMQKLQLSFIFLLGSFVVFTSIYRFSLLFRYSRHDPTWTLGPSWAWCVVECGAGIMSACMPTMGPFMKGLGSKLGMSTSNPSDHTRSGTNLKTIGGSGTRHSRMPAGATFRSASSPFNILDEEISIGSDESQEERLVPKKRYTTTGEKEEGLANSSSGKDEANESTLNDFDFKSDFDWLHESPSRSPELGKRQGLFVPPHYEIQMATEVVGHCPNAVLPKKERILADEREGAFKGIHVRTEVGWTEEQPELSPGSVRRPEPLHLDIPPSHLATKVAGLLPNSLLSQREGVVVDKDEVAPRGFHGKTNIDWSKEHPDLFPGSESRVEHFDMEEPSLHMATQITGYCPNASLPKKERTLADKKEAVLKGIRVKTDVAWTNERRTSSPAELSPRQSNYVISDLASPHDDPKFHKKQASFGRLVPLCQGQITTEVEGCCPNVRPARMKRSYSKNDLRDHGELSSPTAASSGIMVETNIEVKEERLVTRHSG